VLCAKADDAVIIPANAASEAIFGRFTMSTPKICIQLIVWYADVRKYLEAPVFAAPNLPIC
jgi:hypothetical protein